MTTSSIDSLSGEHVIAVTFTDNHKAFDALTALEELDSQGQIHVIDASVVSRSDDGRVQVKDEVGDDLPAGTAGGGLVGLLIGILGGPVGVLIGGAAGLLAGSLYDLVDAEDTDSVLTDMSMTIQAGRTALLAQVVEQSSEVVDNAMARLSGTVLRRSVYDVEAEVAAAHEAERKAKVEARKELIKARHEKHRDEAHAKVEELKAKFDGVALPPIAS
jgi:uncharacterized membrane protein